MGAFEQMLSPLGQEYMHEAVAVVAREKGVDPASVDLDRLTIQIEACRINDDICVESVRRHWHV